MTLSCWVLSEVDERILLETILGFDRPLSPSVALERIRVPEKDYMCGVKRQS